MSNAPLKRNVARFQNWYIRFDLNETASLEADAYQVCGWQADGTPVFFGAGPGAPGTDPSAARRTFYLLAKWDGCCHLNVGSFNFNDPEELDGLRDVIAWIRDDLCEQNGVTDG